MGREGGNRKGEGWVGEEGKEITGYGQGGGRERKQCILAYITECG